MKQIWVKVDPWDKELVTTALESGADAVWVPAGRSQEVKALGLVRVIAPGRRPGAGARPARNHHPGHRRRSRGHPPGPPGAGGG